MRKPEIPDRETGLICHTTEPKQLTGIAFMVENASPWASLLT
jgi:hypothetical protein